MTKCAVLHADYTEKHDVRFARKAPFYAESHDIIRQPVHKMGRKLVYSGVHSGGIA